MAVEPPKKEGGVAKKPSLTRWRQLDPKSAGPAPGGSRHDRIMEAIEHEVRDGEQFVPARPHVGKEWLTKEWVDALLAFGRLRDNETDAQGKPYRDNVKALLTCLPDELVEYAPEVAAPGATQDDIFKGLWNLLKKHQGEAVLFVCVCVFGCVIWASCGGGMGSECSYRQTGG